MTLRVQGQPCTCVQARRRRTLVPSRSEHASWHLPAWRSHGRVNMRGLSRDRTQLPTLYEGAGPGRGANSDVATALAGHQG